MAGVPNILEIQPSDISLAMIEATSLPQSGPVTINPQNYVSTVNQTPVELLVSIETEKPMKPVDVKALIDQGVLFVRDKEKGHSAVWRSFQEVVNKDGERQKFVQCRNCNSIMVFDASRYGTSNLNRHVVKCTGQSAITPRKKDQPLKFDMLSESEIPITADAMSSVQMSEKISMEYEDLSKVTDASRDLTPTEVAFKIQEGIFSVRKKVKAQSVVWSIFLEVLDENGSLLDFVSCQKCESVLVYKGNVKSGTSHLTRHLIKCLSETYLKQQDQKKRPKKATSAVKKEEPYMTLMDIEIVENLLKQGVLTFRDRLKARSPVWSAFHEIVDKNGEFQNFVQCKKCGMLLIFHGTRKSGCSHLLRHKLKCEKDELKFHRRGRRKSYCKRLLNLPPTNLSVGDPPVAVTTEDVQKLIAEGTFLLRKRDRKSEVWQMFEEVVNQNGEFQNLVKCMKCGELILFRGPKKSGTSCLHKHQFRCSGSPGYGGHLEDGYPHPLDYASLQWESPFMSPEEVEKAIQDGIFRLRKRESVRPQKSSVWDTFLEVVNEKGEYQEFVKCQKCNTLLVFRGHKKSGTSHLNKHQLKCASDTLKFHRKFPTAKDHPIQRSQSRTTTYVKKLIEDGVFKVRNRLNVKSPIWDTFQDVVNAQGEYQNYVKCCKCDTLFVFKGAKKSGMSNLKKHKLKCGQSPTVPTKIRSEIIDKCAVMCTKDLRPYDLVTGKGFQELAQYLINIGAQKGKVKASDILPPPSLIAEYATKEQHGTNTKTALVAASDYGIGVTANAWTDDSTKRSYISVKTHFISDTFDLMLKELSTAEMDPEILFSVGNDLEDISKHIMEFEMGKSPVHNVTFVAVPPSESVSIQQSGKLFSASHLLDNVLKLTFDQSLEVEAPEVLKCISASKALLKYIEETGLASCIPPNLYQECENNWHATFVTLDTVLQMYQDVVIHLQNKQHDFMLQDIRFDILQFLVEFLRVFQEANNQLQFGTSPTLQKVLVWYSRLREHCEVGFGDDSLSSALKFRASTFLDQNVHIHALHKVATFLWPEFRHLQMLSREAASEVYEDIRQRLNILREKYPEPTESGDQSTSSSVIPEVKESYLMTPGSGVVSQTEYNYGAYPLTQPQQQQPPLQTNTERDEVTRYLETEFPPLMEDSELLAIWKTNAVSFPLLTKLARAILAIPASSATNCLFVKPTTVGLEG